jgi:hypothetical protein
VMVLPVALRVSRRMKTARSSFLGMIFSNPTEQIRISGTLPERSALPSLVNCFPGKTTDRDVLRYGSREIFCLPQMY